MARFSTDKLICPYCGREQENHEPDVIDADMANTECEGCGKLFEYSVSIRRSYLSTKMEDDSDDKIEDDYSGILFR